MVVVAEERLLGEPPGLFVGEIVAEDVFYTAALFQVVHAADDAPPCAADGDGQPIREPSSFQLQYPSPLQESFVNAQAFFLENRLPDMLHFQPLHFDFLQLLCSHFLQRVSELQYHALADTVPLSR